MPVFLGIPLIGWIPILIGAAITAFVLIKYLVRPKRKKTDGYQNNPFGSLVFEHVRCP